MLDGSRFTGLVVGGGTVALRKVRALLDGGVRVIVVASTIHPDLRALDANAPLTLITAPYSADHIGDAFIVIAATDDAEVNARVAHDALVLGRLVNVADVSGEGNFSTPAVHRSGDLTIAVSAGRLPAAAGVIRDAISARFDTRYGAAVAELRGLRDRMLANGDRDQWKALAEELLGERFCSDVESGAIASRVGSWR